MTKPATTITINGRLYDAITGMPVTSAAPHEHHHKPAPKPAGSARPQRAFSDIAPRPAEPGPAVPPRNPEPPAKPVAHQTVHRQPQKSQTLYRRALRKPEPSLAEVAEAVSPAQRSPLISKFGPEHQAPAQTPQLPQTHAEPEDRAATSLHPTVARALQRQAAQAPPQQLAGKELKEQLIKERLAEVGNSPKKDKAVSGKRQPRIATILTTTLALLILGGYLTYINLPDISMRVAASRAGIDAKMPHYKPDGYSLNGPITYAPGEVAINYRSNTNETGFRLTQKATNWDSQAVLDNYVSKQTDNYLTYQQQGVTVYTFGNKAAWVNGGQLFIVEGDAALASEQILRLATSM